MTRLPLLVSFVLFLALCASLTYWALQIFAPAPRLVSAPPQAERKLAPVTAAENLFGHQGQANTMANMILRGVIYAGRTADSEAILVAGNEPPKYVKVSAQVTDGVTVREIHARHVVLDDHGVIREVSLPAFAPTPVVAAIAGTNNQPQQLQPAQPPQPPQPPQPANQQPAAESSTARSVTDPR